MFKQHYAQTTLFSILIASCILFLVAGMMAGTIIKVYNKAEECKVKYEQWQYQQESQFTQGEMEDIDNAINDLIKWGENYDNATTH